jgi:predicted deacylase
MAKTNCSIDLSAPGKHAGLIRITVPQNRSSFYTIPIPIVSIRNGNGPTVLLLGGSHGDEFEAQVALTKLAQVMAPAQINGQLIILPMANYPAAKAGLRKSPLDDADLNRSYSESAGSGPTRQIASFIELNLLARTDYLLDLHSGGYSSIYHPISIVLGGVENKLLEASIALARAFGLSEMLMLEGGADADKGNNIMAATTRRGIPSLTVEIGGGGMLERGPLAVCEGGVQGVLKHLGILRGETAAHVKPTPLVSTGPDCFLYARHDGLFESGVSLGDRVQWGQIAGTLYFPDDPSRAAEVHHFARNGIVINVRAPALAERGDMLVRLAHEPHV